ncbi:MAG: hypothetical protein MUC87_21070 [Bacteroidia bacterium]|jgi:hypothetical protein|nr:hypothetical protein [Bacteroidia bacterium]
MLFKRFLFSSLIFILAGAGFYLFNDSRLDFSNGNSIYTFDFAYLLFSAGISLLASGLFLIYIEIIQKKEPPYKLTRISFLLHMAGLLVLLITLAFSYSMKISNIPLVVQVFIYTGLFLAVAGMSLLPAIMLIALRRK